MNPYLIIAALVAVMASGACGFKLGRDHEVAAQAREDQHIAQAVDAANEVAAQAIAKLRPKYTTIQQEVQRETKSEVRYVDCHNTPGVMQQLNEALKPGDQAAGNRQLPGVDAAK